MLTLLPVNRWTCAFLWEPYLYISLTYLTSCGQSFSSFPDRSTVTEIYNLIPRQAWIVVNAIRDVPRDIIICLNGKIIDR